MPSGPSPHAHHDQPVAHADALAALLRRYGVPVGWSPTVAWVLKPAPPASGAAPPPAPDASALLELVRTDVGGPPSRDGLSVRLTFNPGVPADRSTPALVIPTLTRGDLDQALKTVGDALNGWRPLRP